MGGGSYSRDVGYSSSSGSFSSGGRSSKSAKKALSRSGMDISASPMNRRIKSEKKNPVIIMLDVTGSNIEFARIVYDKAPMLYGQIEQQGYLEDFDMCFSAVGDATCDNAPLQVGDFQTGIKLDDELKKLFLEGCGGGQRKETYELGVHFFNQFCDMPNAEMPFLFIIGDEAPYPNLDSDISKKVLGKSVGEDLDTKVIFSEALRKFKGNVFFLQNPYCGKESYSNETSEIRQVWVDYLGARNSEKIIPIHEEKSVVDVILGVIAMVSRTKKISGYLTDMKDRGQTTDRIGNVKKSLGKIGTSLVPVADVDLPAKKGKGRKL